jgi:hypothetical protein
VQDNVSGFHFRANDPGSLAAVLLKLSQSGPTGLAAAADGARALLASRFDPAARAADYHAVIMRALR